MAAVAGTLAKEKMASHAGEAVQGLEAKGSDPTAILQKFNTSFPKPQPHGENKKEDSPQPELTPNPSPEQDQVLSGVFNKLFTLTSSLTNVDPEVQTQTLSLVNDTCSQLQLPKPQETLQAVQDGLNPHAAAAKSPSPTLTPATSLQQDLTQIAADHQLSPTMTRNVLQGINKGTGGLRAHLPADKLKEQFTAGAQEVQTNAVQLQSHGLSKDLIEPGLNFMHQHNMAKGTKANAADVAQTLVNMPRELAHDMNAVGKEFSQHINQKKDLGKQLHDELIRPGPPRPGGKSKTDELEQTPGLSSLQLSQAKDIGLKFLMSPEGQGHDPKQVAGGLRQAVHDDPSVLGKLANGTQQVGQLVETFAKQEGHVLGAHDNRQVGTTRDPMEKPKLPAAFSTKLPNKPKPPGEQ